MYSRRLNSSYVSLLYFYSLCNSRFANFSVSQLHKLEWRRPQAQVPHPLLGGPLPYSSETSCIRVPVSVRQCVRHSLQRHISLFIQLWPHLANYAVKAAWCRPICSVKSCVIHAERFRSGVIHSRRYTNGIPLPIFFISRQDRPTVTIEY